MTDVEELFSRLRSTPFVESYNAVPQEIGNRGGITPSGWLADNSVTADVIQANAVVAGKIAADAVTANEIAAGSITTTKLAANAVTANKIAANTITANEIAANTLTANEIAANAITANELSANSVETNHIVAANVTSAKIVATLSGKKYGGDDGTNGAPGFFFDTESTLGIYRFGSGGMALATGGVDAFRVAGGSSGSRDLLPLAHNTYDLGNSVTRWSTIYLQNAPDVSSDARLKQDIADSPLGLGFVRSLRPVVYRWRDAADTQARNAVSFDQAALDAAVAHHEARIRRVRQLQQAGADEAQGDRIIARLRTKIAAVQQEHLGPLIRAQSTRRPGRRLHLGLIAQEVKEALDAHGADVAVWKQDAKTGEQSLDYSQFIAPLVRAVQELSAQVEELRAFVRQ